jgi:Domain of unknown function (DUF4918)
MPDYFSEQILDFLFTVKLPFAIPEGIEVLYPFDDDVVREVCTRFYKQFYHHRHQRRLLIGINPGRFGGGVTGIPFTDPIRLESKCHIASEWKKKAELSSIYMYEMMDAYGGCKAFYQDFYITSVSPLGFTKDGKNLNYYDDKALQQSVTPFAVDCFRKQIDFGIDTSVAFCLGDGKNFSFLTKLNAAHHLFDRLVPLSHPRFIMQYKLRQKENYIAKYLEAFSS